MIGVLISFDSREAISRKHLVRLLFLELGDLSRPGDAAFDTNLDFGLDSFGPVEAADGNIDVIRSLVGESQGRAAGRTETPVHIGRTLEDGRLPPGRPSCLVTDLGRRSFAS